MKPWPEQIELAQKGFDILSKHGLVYFAMEERTGKTLTSALVCEMCPNVTNVLVITKLKAIKGWVDTLKAWDHTKTYTVVNYHQAKKHKGNFQLVILDEAHSYISAYPKRSAMWSDIHKLIYGVPIIYSSATPHAQGKQMLFNQFAMSKYSPFKKYKDFYTFFKDYAVRKNGELPTVRIGPAQTAVDYKAVNDELIEAAVKHLFITRTRKEQGFEFEPVDHLHYIQLSNSIKDVYNTLAKDRMLEFTHANSGKDYTLICDSGIKLRWALHMLEGGTLKIDNEYIDLGNVEKVDYILQTWGDTKDLAIMYQYKADKIKLEKYFKNAELFQATSFAEGVDLSHKEHLVIYSQDFSTAKHSQRRARQANRARNTPINVHFLLVKKGISEQVYKTVAVNKQDFVDSRFILETL